VSDDSFSHWESELQQLARRRGKPGLLIWLLPEKIRFRPHRGFVVRAGDDRAAIQAQFHEARTRGWAIRLETVCYSRSTAFATIELARSEAEIESFLLRLGTVTLSVGENDLPVRVIRGAPCWWFWKTRTHPRGASLPKR
jgi:hypothetical protein